MRATEAVRLRPRSNWVLVYRNEPRRRTDAGVILLQGLDPATNPLMLFTVEAIGPEVREVKPGFLVLMGLEEGTKLLSNHQMRYMLIREQDIAAVCQKGVAID